MALILGENYNMSVIKGYEGEMLEPSLWAT